MPQRICIGTCFLISIFISVSLSLHFSQSCLHRVRSDARSELAISTPERLRIDADLSHQQDRAVDLVALYGKSSEDPLRHRIMVSTTSSWTTNGWYPCRGWMATRHGWQGDPRTIRIKCINSVIGMPGFLEIRLCALRRKEVFAQRTSFLLL